MPKIKYYCHLKEGRVKIFKGVWTDVCRIAGTMGIPGGQLSGKENESLEQAISFCEKEARSARRITMFNPKHTTVFDCTVEPYTECVLDESGEYRALRGLRTTKTEQVALDKFLAGNPAEDIVIAAIEEKKVDLSAWCSDRRTLLHYAAQDGMLAATTKILQSRLARLELLDFQNEDGFSALDLAAMACHTAVVRFLIESRASVNIGVFGLISHVDAERVLKTAQAFPSVKGLGCVVHFEVVGEKWQIKGLDFEKNKCHKVPDSVVTELRAKYGFATGVPEEWHIRHKKSVSSLMAEYRKRYTGKAVLSFFEGDFLNIAQHIGKAFAEEAHSLDNLFIGDATENLAYGSVFTAIDRAVQRAEKQHAEKGACDQVEIAIVDQGYQTVFAANDRFKGFYQSDTARLFVAARSDPGRIRALAKLLHYDDPRYARCPPLPAAAAEAESKRQPLRRGRGNSALLIGSDAGRMRLGGVEQPASEDFSLER